MHVCVTGDRPRHSHSHSHLNEIRRYHFGLSSAFLKRAAWYVTILTTNAAIVQFPRQVFSPQAPRASSMRSPKVEVLLLMGDAILLPASHCIRRHIEISREHGGAGFKASPDPCNAGRGHFCCTARHLGRLERQLSLGVRQGFMETANQFIFIEGVFFVHRYSFFICSASSRIAFFPCAERLSALPFVKT